MNHPESVSSQKDAPRGRAVFPLAAVMCLALILATWANSLPNGFHFDDSHYIVNNLFLRDLAHAPLYFRDARTFSSLPANQTSPPPDDTLSGPRLPIRRRPLVIASFTPARSCTWRCSGRLSGSSTDAVFDTCQPARENRYLALLAATVFAVHTANADTMNLLSARSEILSALGLVGAFLAYFSLRGRKRTIVSLLSMALGALAKVPAVLSGRFSFSGTSWRCAIRSRSPDREGRRPESVGLSPPRRRP